MILRELFYYDKETLEGQEDLSFDETSDKSPLTRDDTRKTRFTLRQINKLRQSSDFHNEEVVKELDFIRQMYGIAANAETGM